MEDHIPCDLVIEHQKLLGEMSANIEHIGLDVSYIRERVDNGLSTKVEAIERALNLSISDGKIANAETRAENWFTRILSGSISKIISLAIIFIVVNAMVSSGFGLFVKEKYLQEIPGQQKEILQKQTVLMTALGSTYHTHVMSDDRILLHAGNRDEPAWILDPKTGFWSKAPLMRTEKQNK